MANTKIARAKYKKKFSKAKNKDGFKNKTRSPSLDRLVDGTTILAKTLPPKGNPRSKFKMILMHSRCDPYPGTLHRPDRYVAVNTAVAMATVGFVTSAPPRGRCPRQCCDAFDFFQKLRVCKCFVYFSNWRSLTIILYSHGQSICWTRGTELYVRVRWRYVV